MPEIIRYSRYRANPDTPPSTAFPREHVHHYPLVDVKLTIAGSSTPPLKVLIDSGAAYCIFGADTADILGIKVRSGKLKRGLHGFGGGSVDVYFFDTELAIGTLRLNCYAGFMERDFPGNGIWIGLLGGFTFLDQIPVAFDVGKLQIRIG